MLIKELVEKLEELNQYDEIYIQNDLQLYEPVITNEENTDTNTNYFVLNKGEGC